MPSSFQFVRPAAVAGGLMQFSASGLGSGHEAPAQSSFSFKATAGVCVQSADCKSPPGEKPRGMHTCQACLETTDDLQSELNWNFLFVAF